MKNLGRAIRQALMSLAGSRPCTWIDAMGYDQAAWAESLLTEANPIE